MLMASSFFKFYNFLKPWKLYRTVVKTRYNKKTYNCSQVSEIDLDGTLLYK